ncbi:MAG: YetF domain-containing protein [Erythrobacter sp.]
MLEEWILTPWTNVALIALSASGMYLVLIGLTRAAGIRSFSKMSGFDFAVTVAIGSVFASIIVAKDPPVASGFAALAALFALQIGFAALRSRWDIVGILADNKPRLIMIGEAIQHDQLKKARMTEADLLAKLREANVLNFSQVALVIAETTGDVSVLHSSDPQAEVADGLLAGVIAAERYSKSHA